MIFYNSSKHFQISDSVVDRLRNELEKPNSAPTPPPQTTKPPEPEPIPQPAPQPPPAAKEEPVEVPALQTPPQQPQAPVSNQKPIIQYVEKDPSLSSLRVKAEKEKELSEAETYWRKRFVQQEQEVSLKGNSGTG